MWRAKIPNSIFGEYNPYTVKIFGDWYDAVKPLHTGEVYINNKALYETDSLEEVLNPVIYKAHGIRKAHCTNGILSRKIIIPLYMQIFINMIQIWKM